MMVDRATQAAIDRMNAGLAGLERDYPRSDTQMTHVPIRDPQTGAWMWKDTGMPLNPTASAAPAAAEPSAPSGFDPSKIEAARTADTGNVQSVRDWLHQFSQMTPESPDTVKARLLAKTTRAMDPALVNADIRTPEQNTAIFQRIYGDQTAPASTAVDTAKNVIQARATPPASTAPVSQNEYAIAGYEPSDQNVSAPISNVAPPAATQPVAARAPAPAVAREAPMPPRRPAEFSQPATEQGNKSLLSSLLGRLTPQDPYAGMSRAQMGAKAQEMQSSGDEYGANLLTQRLDRSITSPEQQSSDGNFKRGGTAGGGQKAGGMHKDAALHKALDIIHTMLTRGH